MTGGRLTRNTNDSTIAYARARRDLGCRYTLGFYDRHPEEDKRHRISVESRRPGVHLIHAARYSFPSAKERRILNLEAAYLAPRQFEGGGLRAHLFPLQPQSPKSWDAVLAMDFPVDLAAKDGTSTREFGAVLLRGSEPVHSFQRSITLEPPEAAADSPGAAPRVTFVEPVTLGPGTYSLTAVMSDPKGEVPFGAVGSLTLPKIPRREPILSGPILGRRRGSDVVVYGGGDAGGASADRVGAKDAFRPLLVDEVDRTEPVAALTTVCVVGAKAKDPPWTIHRGLVTASGEPAGSLADFTLRPAGKLPVQCERLLDELPVARMKPGLYTFRAVLDAAGRELTGPTEGTVPFRVE